MTRSKITHAINALNRLLSPVSPADLSTEERSGLVVIETRIRGLLPVDVSNRRTLASDLLEDR